MGEFESAEVPEFFVVLKGEGSPLMSKGGVIFKKGKSHYREYMMKAVN